MVTKTNRLLIWLTGYIMSFMILGVTAILFEVENIPLILIIFILHQLGWHILINKYFLPNPQPKSEEGEEG